MMIQTFFTQNLTTKNKHNHKESNFYENHTAQLSLQNKTNAYFYFMLLCNTVLLFFMVGEISIYSKEAAGFFENTSLPFHLANFGVNCVNLFFQNPLLNDYGLRLPFILIHICNCILMYKIGLCILRKSSDALLCVFLFMAIPGVSIGALFVSYVGIITLISLLIVYYQVRYNKILYPLFVIIVFLGSGGAILCLALFFYALLKKHNKTLVFAIICFGINMYIFAPIHGAPQAYTFDAIGLLSLVFTPALFIYYVAAMYTSALRKPTLLNLIPLIGFTFILLFSTRQHINIENFLPPLSIGMPFFVEKILFDIRCRLQKFRLRYSMRLWSVIACLIFGNVILFGNKLTYLSNNTANFAYSFYGAKEIAKELHKRNIPAINITNPVLKQRLQFYGINATPNHPAPHYTLQESQDGTIKIKFLNQVIMQYDIIETIPQKTSTKQHSFSSKKANTSQTIKA